MDFAEVHEFLYSYFNLSGLETSEPAPAGTVHSEVEFEVVVV
jgi:hypothetical protein